ncbi:MAG: DUF2911 domain-containing protein [Acidobacteriota bacterium]
MKKLIYCVLIIVFLGVGANAQFPAGYGWVFPRESPSASVSQTVGVSEITIKYHRPMVKGRKIWGCQTTDIRPNPSTNYGCLVPNGQVWRAGANDATTITFSTPVIIEGQTLSAGTYGLFIIPSETEWTIIFNKRARQWGSFSYNETEDALRIKVKPQTSEHQERLKYDFPDVSNYAAQIALHWEKVKVIFNVTVETDKLTSAKAKTSFDPASGYFAADYYYQNKTNLDEALKWINAALAFDENGSNLMLKAKILAELKRYGEAIETAERAVKIYRDKKQIKPLEAAENLISEWNKLKQ